MASEIDFITSGFAETCPSPIRDEFSSGIDSDLQQAIDRFQAKGVTVYVDLTRTMQDEGFRVTEFMDDDEFFTTGNAYVESVFESCDLDTTNTVTFVRVQDDLFVDVVMSGVQNDYKKQNPNEFENVVDVFFDEVQDGGTETLQDDVAVALNALYDAEYEESQGGNVPNTPTPHAEVSAKDPIDIPVIPIALGSIGIVFASGIAILGRNKALSRREKLKFDDIAQKHEISATKAFTQNELNSESPLLSTPAEDIPELIELHEKIQKGYEKWEELQDQYRTKIAAEYKGFRPKRSELKSVVSEYLQEASEYQELITNFEEQIAELNERKAGIGDVLGGVAEQLQAVQELAIALTTVGNVALGTDAKPYTMTQILNQIKSIFERHDLASQKFNFENYINLPVTISNENTSALANIETLLSTLPETHNRLAESTEALKATLAKHEQDGAKLEDTRASIVENYDTSCLGDIPEQVALAIEANSNLQNKLNEIGDPSTNFDVDQLILSEDKLAEAIQLVEQFESAASNISSHVAMLENIKSNALPVLDEIDGDLGEIAQYIDTYAEFIDDSTEQELIDLIPQVDTLRAQLTNPKPAYIQSQAKLTDLKESVDNGIIKAKAEHQEIIDLEEFNKQAKNSFSSELSELSDYEARNDDVDADTEHDIDSLELPELPTARSRHELRQAKQLLQEALTQLEEIKNDAHGDVQREQARREAIRRAAEEKARQARQAEERAQRAREQARRDRESASRLSTSHSSSMRLSSSSHSSGRSGSSSHSSRRG